MSDGGGGSTAATRVKPGNWLQQFAVYVFVHRVPVVAHVSRLLLKAHEFGHGAYISDLRYIYPRFVAQLQ